MATIDDLISDVQNWTLAGITGASTTLTTTQCAEFVNAAIRRLERHKAWWFQYTTTRLAIPGISADSVSGGTIGLPSNFISEEAVYTVDPTQTSPDATLVPIQKTLRGFWYEQVDPLALRDPIFPSVRAVSNATLNQDRRYYALTGASTGVSLTIFPTPSSAITVQLEYWRTFADLKAGTAYTNPFTTLYPDCVRAGAVAEANWYLQEGAQAAVWEARFASAREECVKHANALTAGGQGGSRGV